MNTNQTLTTAFLIVLPVIAVATRKDPEATNRWMLRWAFALLAAALLLIASGEIQ